MRTVILHNKVFNYLKDNGIDCIYNEEKDNIAIAMQIENEIYDFTMEFPQYYPYEFPIIKIKEKKDLTIPHIYRNHELCLYDVNERSPNPDNYLEDALDIVHRAEKLLVDSANNENLNDFNIEAVSYWNARSDGRVDFLSDANEKSQILWGYKLVGEYYVVADEQKIITDFINNSYDIKTGESNKFCQVLYLNVGKVMLLGIETIGSIHSIIPKSELLIFYKYLVRNSGKGIVILCADNGKGKCLLPLKVSLLSNRIKIALRNVKGVLAANKNREFLRLELRNFQMRRIFTRSGDGVASFEKNCLVVGCGSVGSFLAKSLVDIGIVKKITLVDNDILSVDNIGRHLCGSDYLLTENTSKVNDLRAELLKHYPALDCDVIEDNIWEYLLNEESFFDRFDSIFISVGNTAIEKRIFQLLKEGKISKECIILWGEPYLIAGHALIFQNEINEVTEKNIFDQNGNFDNGVLVDSHQYMKSEAGCQSSYAPYAGFEVQKFILDFIDTYYRKIYGNKHNYEFVWIGKIGWARKEKMIIKPRWRAKDDRTIILKRIDE